MYRDKRHTFRTLVFCSPHLTSIADAALFLEGKLFQKETLIQNDDICIMHAYYHTKSEFTLPDLIKDMIVPNVDDITTYKYNIYFSIVRIIDKTIILISVPYSKMASEVFGAFSVFARGKSVKYQKVDLPKFIELSNLGHNMEGDVKITSIDIEVEGDSPTKTIILKGTNVPASSTYTGVIESLDNKKYKIRGCSIIYDNKKDIKQIFKVDRFGMYLLPIKANAKNLPSILNIFGYFANEKLIIEDSFLPAVIKSDEEEDDDR